VLFYELGHIFGAPRQKPGYPLKLKGYRHPAIAF
jgi:hypothetical protein